VVLSMVRRGRRGSSSRRLRRFALIGANGHAVDRNWGASRLTQIAGRLQLVAALFRLTPKPSETTIDRLICRFPRAVIRFQHRPFLRARNFPGRGA